MIILMILYVVITILLAIISAPFYLIGSALIFVGNLLQRPFLWLVLYSEILRVKTSK